MEESPPHEVCKLKRADYVSVKNANLVYRHSQEIKVQDMFLNSS